MQEDEGGGCLRKEFEWRVKDIGPLQEWIGLVSVKPSVAVKGGGGGTKEIQYFRRCDEKRRMNTTDYILRKT